MTRVSYGHIDHIRCAVVNLSDLFHRRKPVHSGPQPEGHHKQHIVAREDEEASVKPAVENVDQAIG